MVTAFVALLLLMDGLLLWQLAGRLGLGPRRKQVLGGTFIAGSLAVLTWLIWVPGVVSLFSSLGWIFVISLPAAWYWSTDPESPSTGRQVRRIQPTIDETDDTPLQAKPTPDEELVLKDLGLAGGLLASVIADLSPQGAYQRRLVAVSAAHLACVSDEEKKLFHAPLEKIEKISSESLVGGGRLEATLDDGTIHVVARYSNVRARDFILLAKKLGDYLDKRKKREEYEQKLARGDVEAKGEDPPEVAELSFADIDDEGPKRCPKCERRLGENTKVCPACVNKTQAVVRLLQLASSYWSRLALMGALMVIGTLMSLTPPYLTKILVDEVLTGAGIGSLLAPIVLALALVMLLGTVIAAIRARIGIWVGAKITQDLRARCFHHLQTLSLGYFDQQKVGGLMSRVHHDTGRLEHFLTEGIQYTVINALLIVGITIMLLVMNWQLALFVLLPAPVMILFSWWFWGRVFGLWRRLWEKLSRFSAFLNDTLSGVRVVKAFGQEGQEISRFDRRNTDLFDATVVAERMWATFYPGLGLLMQSGGLLVWYFGGLQVVDHRITLGTLMAFIAYLAMFYGPLQLISRLNDWLTRSLAAAERVFEVLDAEPDVKDAPGAERLPPIVGAVTFDEVTFGYDPLKPVLKDFTLQVKPGEMIGLVGHSGAGKSTTVNLLCRLYDVQEGAICIDGHDVRQVVQESLRKQVGVVLQETYLFGGSIAENIAYAKPDATPEQIMAAAVAANAHDFIMKKSDGYDTIVGERGANLSGGEKQRVAIARAVLHDPRILILDEATASVDTETEQQIQQALQRLIRGRTTFAIAHRLSTLRNADRLVVLEDGKIVECGSHRELLEKDGLYARLVKVQSEMSTIMALSS